MADSAMKMRLLHNEATNQYCLLYADGTMTKFSTDNNDAATCYAMTDLFTRYNKPGLTAYGENAERWQTKTIRTGLICGSGLRRKGQINRLRR